jgi:histidine triad (HIT) family protein
MQIFIKNPDLNNEADVNCLFCKIATGEIAVTKVYEDNDVIAFYDLHPQAPTHILLVPKEHISSLNDTAPENITLLGNLLIAAKKISIDNNFSQEGYRVVINTHVNGGQSIWHLHLHLLAGRQMTWPPG